MDRIMRSEKTLWLTVALTCVGYCLSPNLSHATTFNVSPIRVELSAVKPTSFLTITNDDGAPKVVQVELMAWSQAEQRNIFVPSNDIVVNPPIFTVKPGSTQIVRLGLRRPIDADHELSYRLFLTEVPPPVESAAQRMGQGLQIVLRLSVPIFISTQNKPVPTLSWKAVSDKDGAIHLTATNTGNMHFQIQDFKLTVPASSRVLAKQTGAVYLLPEQSWHWRFNPDTHWRADSLYLSARTDSGDINEEVELQRQ